MTQAPEIMLDAGKAADCALKGLYLRQPHVNFSYDKINGKMAS
jgi:hypothetical protein